MFKAMSTTVSKRCLQHSSKRSTRLLHDTRFSFRESDMTSGLVLDELDLNLSPASLLVGLGLLVVVVIVGADLAGVVVLDERVVARADGLRGRVDGVEPLAFIGGWRGGSDVRHSG